jgi:hypothetical protein
MKKILILLLFLLSVGLQGQILPGVVAASGQVTAAGIPACLTDGNTFAWYSAEVGNVTKDGSNLVSNWDDLSANDYDLVQATGTNQPVWSADGITFDGSDNFMSTGAKVLVQPTFVYCVVKLIIWSGNGYFFDGEEGYYHGGVYGYATTPQIRARANTESSNNDDLVVGDWTIIRVLFYGASSKLIVDAHDAVTGDFGALEMNGFCVGTIGDQSVGYFANVIFKEIIIRKVADSAGNETAIYTYLKTKHGL